jgi:hypothetical protein
MRSVYFLFAAMLAAPLSHAETFEEYKRHVSSEYQEYKDKRDREFVDFLKKQWSEFQGYKGLPLYQEPKPKVMPIAKAKPADIKEPPRIKEKEPARIVTEPARPVLSPAPVSIFTPPAVPADPSKKIATLDYFGVPIKLPYDPKIRQPLAVIDQNGISNYWSALSKADYDPLLEQLKMYQKNMQLNDWGTFILIDKLARTINQNQENESVLLSWFLLSKLGYDSKVGYNDKTVYLMVVVSHTVYQTAFFKDEPKTYYCLSNSGRVHDVGKLYSYKGNYPDATRALNFTIRSNPLLAGEAKKRQLSFRYNNTQHDITAQYSPALISYYQFYPQSEYPIYFSANINDPAMTSLLAQLAPLLKGKSEQEAVNLLLRFVQTSFPYETDEQQFSYEKVMLPEETLFYPYSDCEDRAILFAYLVRNLLDLPVIALHYPGHLATAVSFSGKVDGDAVIYKGKTFTVADPTYINANAGMAMPQFKNSTYKIIEM